MVNERAQTTVNTTPPIAAERFDGGGQAIAFNSGWLVLVRDSEDRHGIGRFHRFVWFNAAHQMKSVSPPFHFHNNGVDAASGIAWHPDAHRF